MNSLAHLSARLAANPVLALLSVWLFQDGVARFIPHVPVSSAVGWLLVGP